MSTYKDKELEMQAVNSVYEMAASSLNPEDFDVLLRLLLRLCERRNVAWDPADE